MYFVLLSTHLLFVIGWLCGLFYLPRLFVYHATLAHNDSAYMLLLRMERNLLRFISVNMGISIIVGGILAWQYGWYLMAWFHAKLLLVFVLMVYQWGCRFIFNRFHAFSSPMRSIHYRFFNEIPVLLVFGIIWLAIAKPHLLG